MANRISITVDPEEVFRAILDGEAAAQGAINDARRAAGIAADAEKEARNALAKIQAVKEALAVAVRAARGED